jgi:hypothetical protein
MRESAAILTEGLFAISSAKTAHGLVREALPDDRRE